MSESDVEYRGPVTEYMEDYEHGEGGTPKFLKE
jgi:hypothetical protein